MLSSSDVTLRADLLVVDDSPLEDLRALTELEKRLEELRVA